MKKSIDGYIRSQNNPGAALNTDNAALQAYKKRKHRDNEIDNIREEVKDIKLLLTQVLEKLNK